jgi:hypothetical protein
MGLGLIDQTVLQDIGNAIRYQNGTSKSIRPADMAAAVLALDGTKAGTGAQVGIDPKVGVISDKVFSDIASAIRQQNGLTVKYRPGEMAQAIRDLVWDVGLKPRALLLSDGTLEFNYLDGRQVKSGSAAVVEAWEVDPAGYSESGSVPWYEDRGKVTRAYFDSSFAQVGMASAARLFEGCYALESVEGFEALASATDFTFIFNSCSRLKSVYAAEGFKLASGAKGTYPVSSCNRLVGGTGYVPQSSDGAGVLKLGDGGVLTCKASDARTWLWATVYGDGSLYISSYSDYDTTREVALHDSFCAQGTYRLASGLPWYDARDRFTKVRISWDMAQVKAPVNMRYWFYAYGSVTEIAGLGFMRHVRDMSFCFSSCGSLSTLDLRGFDPSELTDLGYAFASCAKLTTITVDSTWALPSGVKGFQTFYNDKALVGGNGTAFSSSKAGVSMCVVDRAGQAGYLTAG